MKNYIIIALTSLLAFGFSITTWAQIITTIAGNPLGDTTDGIPATDAYINYPTCIATDIKGNIYFGGLFTERIKKVSTSGIITTIAGNGISGYSGDGGPATNASINDPMGIAVDSMGNLYIADYLNNCIRKVNTSGIITTFAGTPLTPGYGGDGGPATAATITLPIGVAADRFGNIYISDINNFVIRKITDGIISTFAGNGIAGHYGNAGPATAASLLLPASVAVDYEGNVYIGEDYYDTLGYIRKVNTSGIINTVSGNGYGGNSGNGGYATAASFNGIRGLAVDKYGNIYLSDQLNNEVRAINTIGIVIAYAGDGIMGFSGDGYAADIAQLNAPLGVAVDTGRNLYIVDQGNNRVRRVSALPLDASVHPVIAPLVSIELYPNPCTGAFTITLPAANDKITMNIEDITGRIIETKDITNNTAKQFNFNLSQPPGTYIVKVIADGISYREKVIIW
jgi:hypothetical protein